MLDAIAFDADDTLWHSEYYYREAARSFTDLLEAYGVAPEGSLAALHRIEVVNLPFFGYGIRGYTISMIEAAVHVTGGQVRGADVQAIVELGRTMTSHDIRLLDGAEEALARLANRHRLLLITKGDVLDQERKIQRSGLARYFRHVEIVSDKTPAAYSLLLERHKIDPIGFLMVGNSLRSDIAPVLALGGYAVHVPYELTWAHESEADLPADRSRFFEISSLHALSELIDQIENSRSNL